MNKQQWMLALQSHVRAQRKKTPVPERESLTEEEEWHCRIIGGEFVGWYQEHLHGILAQRVALRMMSFDPAPLLVYTTTMPGLVAAREILEEPVDNLVCLLHDEFAAWEKRHRVDEFTFHIHHWSYFHSADQELLEQARKKYPTVHPEQFRFHTAGDLWGEQCGVDGDHLWQWDGHEMQLLEEAFEHRVF